MINSHRRFAVGLSLVACVVVACSSVERDGADGSAGSAGMGQGGLSAGGSSANAGSGGHAVGGGSTAIAGTSGSVIGSGGDNAAGTGGDISIGAGGDNAAGTGGDKSIGAGGDNAAGTGGDTSIGMAGMGPGAAGEAGGSGTPPPPPPLLKNGSFETGGLAGWQVVVTPDTVGKAVYAQWGSSTGVSIDGAYEVSFWNGTAAFTGDLHQTVTGLTPGTYELKLYIAYGTGINAAYLYAIGCGPQDIQQDLPLTPGVPSFALVSIPSINVTNDSCTVGLFADMNTGDWLNADAFVFDALPAQ